MRVLVLLLLSATTVVAQDLPARWDELTASDWPRALERSAHTAILPIGVLEKHGPHAPIGSDLIHVREWAARVTRTEYAVVLPDLYTGIWWYGAYPNHYAGDGAVATRELGQLITEHRIASIIKALRAIKTDTVTPTLQQEFFDRVDKE